ncbi:GNAT family N-acetyltransferase [Bacillus sp. FJAT-42376]|uniref:GNAT family N-acetyltransferase n=1 Tax=Bacillus sp. FJAT-42376 TaxID=2014076 RepID=UPI000F514EE2|nr:GNAT family N-acetyltransferase [Bacillus sp. FJAT-42376]AZB42426.1 GNAT family N-acetyltransferase [Bacillus sp. FJAT-42376]
MIIKNRLFEVKGLTYSIRSAMHEDAGMLSKVRVRIDGETENMDREQGEGLIDEAGFERLIKNDTEMPGHLFLVAEVEGEIVGFSRCEGNQLKRSSHKAEFGVGVLKDFWGYGIGVNLLKESIAWADSNGIKKMNLNVLETNDRAIKIYSSLGFETEGVLKKDKLLSDGKFYSTILMGRWNGS